jgi:glycosyltransferase involved in cell wall biosynthesis
MKPPGMHLPSEWIQKSVSVILPVFNRRHMIQRAIRSLVDQTFQDWELWIIDDGSTDNVHEDLVPFVMQEPRARYVKQTNQKLSACRNTGILCAQGRYVTFLDSDDEYRPTHLQSRIEYMAENPSVDVIHGGVELRGPDESHWVRDARDETKMIHLSECTIGATIFAKKQVLLTSGGFKPLSYSAESEYVPRLEEHFDVRKVDFQTYVYYTGLQDSICSHRQAQNQSS